MTPNPDSVAVLRELRVGVEMDAHLDPLGAAKLEALDAAIAALSTHGEAAAVVDEDNGLKGVTLLDRSLPVGTKLYLAPGGVGDAVTDFETWWERSREENGGHAIGADYRHWALLGWNAALAARTGKANG